MKKSIKIALAVLIVLVVVFTFVKLYQQSKPKVTVYNIAESTTQTIERRSVATGTISPRNEVSIKPQISGIISQIYKKAGDKVQAGDIIALVKVVPDVANLNAAESRVNVARIEMKQQETDYNRQKELYEDKVISASEFEQSTATYLKCKEELQNAIDNLKIVKEGVASRSGSYSNTQIKATIAGTILDIPVKVGNSVIQANTFNDGTEIATIANLNDMVFEGKIDETEVGRVSVGMPVEIIIGALQNHVFTAELEYIAPKSKAENGIVMFEIKASTQIPDSIMIRAGYSANASIIMDRRENVIAIPESAIEFENDSAFVYVLTSGDSKTQQFERRYVSTGISDGMNIEITSGLELSTKVRNGEVVATK
jgi:RND family efflux transporter, MFP subunit